MTIPLFSGDARRNLLIPRGTDSYAEEGRRQEAGVRRSKLDEDSTPDDLNSVGLNAVNLQPALNEVFHAGS